MRVLPDPVTARSMVISERVSVPVLSVQITEAEPSVSTEESFFTMAWCFVMRCTPIASTTESIAGRPSGTAATARLTPSSSTATTSAGPRISASASTVPTTTTAIAITAIPSMRPIRRTSSCSGVGSSTVASSRRAMAPISVAMPVAVTTASPVPCATAVPLNTMLLRSPSAAGAASVAVPFSTATLSPVSEASSTRSAFACSRRASAPMLSPSPSTSRSPRTSSALGTRCTWPSRSTEEVTAVIFARAAAAFSERACCTKPRVAFSTTIARITIASTGRPGMPSRRQAIRVIATAASSR